jgi:hypothetical protein
LPKKDGGLGIRNPYQMNIAFLMKILWNMINRADDLWCKVLYNKYGTNKDLRVAINSQTYNSPLWKALADIWDHDKSINFWMDRWAPNSSFLMKAATNEAIDSTLNVKNVLTTKGKWNLNFLKNNLPLNVVNQLVALPKPRDTYGPDIVGWRGTNTHHFTVQSAYELQRENIPQMEAD